MTHRPQNQREALDEYRRQRLAKLFERYPIPDHGPELADVPLAYISREGEGEARCPNYAAVVGDGDGGYAIGVHKLPDALRFLATDYPDWTPVGLFHLGTGESIGFEVTTTIQTSPAARIREPDVNL